MEEIYFAHPVNLYNEPTEAALEKLIASCLAYGNKQAIENPNQPRHQNGYRKWSARQKESDTKHKGMNYFFDEVLPHCSGCAAMPFLDLRMGLGVAGEAKWFLERGKPCWIIVPTHMPTPDDIQDFIRHPLNGLFQLRLLNGEEAALLISLDPKLVVPHEETRLRTWKVYNRVIRPYEEAHLITMPIPEGFYPKESGQ